MAKKVYRKTIEDKITEQKLKLFINLVFDVMVEDKKKGRLLHFEPRIIHQDGFKNC